MYIGNRIRKHRVDKGYSQEYMASQLDMSQNGYCKIENDKVDVKLHTLRRIVQVLGISVGQLLGEEGSPPVAAAGGPAALLEKEALYQRLLDNKDRQLAVQEQLLTLQQQEISDLKSSLVQLNDVLNAKRLRQEHMSSLLVGEVLPTSIVEPMLGEAAEAQEVIYQDYYVQISYNRLHHWVQTEWHHYQTMESIRNGCNLTLETVLNKACRKVLRDNRHVKGSCLFAVDWMVDCWLPRLEAAGVELFACVYSTDLFCRQSTTKMIQGGAGSNIRMRAFYQQEEACEWLVSG